MHKPGVGADFHSADSKRVTARQQSRVSRTVRGGNSIDSIIKMKSPQKNVTLFVIEPVSGCLRRSSWPHYLIRWGPVIQHSLVCARWTCKRCGNTSLSKPNYKQQAKVNLLSRQCPSPPALPRSMIRAEGVKSLHLNVGANLHSIVLLTARAKGAKQST